MRKARTSIVADGGSIIIFSCTISCNGTKLDYCRGISNPAHVPAARAYLYLSNLCFCDKPNLQQHVRRTQHGK
jgi:hypothetical protein